MAPKFDVSAEDPRISDLLDALAEELPLDEVADRAFVDEAVYLDGRSFTRCTFNHCVLISRSGIYAMTACDTSNPEAVVIGGPSAILHELMQDNVTKGGELRLAIAGYSGRDTSGRA